MSKVKFQVDTRLAKLLSQNYRSSERALKELVDNTWDADAECVKIYLPTPNSGSPIIIEDNGAGMTEAEVRREYLVIASDRRQRRGEYTHKKHRRVKGRKGIGKFAGLLAANSMKLETWARGKKCEFVLTSSDYESAKDIEELPINLRTSDAADDKHGTLITLSDLNQGFAFPDPDRFRQLLLQEYGREEGFQIFVDDKPLGVDDVKGTYTEIEETLQDVGKIKARFTISNIKGKLRQPGITIRIGGKVVGRPDFFGLDTAEDFPPKLLDKLYGEIEADGLLDHVTGDWGALVENSELYRIVQDFLQPILREKFKEEYGREVKLAQARLQKIINDRLTSLPEYKRQYADKAIKAILGKYYGEPESKVEPIVSVLLDALERSDYRTVLDYIHNARHSDIARIAEVLDEFGLAEIAIIGEQARSRLEFLDQFEQLCNNKDTTENLIHTALEKNLWVLGIYYSVFSSNKTLKAQVEEMLGKNFSGKRANKRPDLMLSVNHQKEFLLIEFKRPSHLLSHENYQQVTRYRNDFVPYTNFGIKVLLLGGRRGEDLPPGYNQEPNTEIQIFSEIISNARAQINWLLKELGGESHA
jgi:hypothetical protein